MRIHIDTEVNVWQLIVLVQLGIKGFNLIKLLIKARKIGKRAVSPEISSKYSDL